MKQWIAVLLHRPLTQQHRLLVTPDSTVEKITLRDAAAALQVDNRRYKLLPPFQETDLAPAEYDGAVQASLSDVQEAIGWAREARQVAHYLNEPPEMHPEGSIPHAVLAELIFQHWPALLCSADPVLQGDHLTPALAEAIESGKGPSIAECESLATLINERTIRDAIVEHLPHQTRACWEPARAAVMGVVIRRAISQAEQLLESTYLGPRQQWSRENFRIRLDQARYTFRRREFTKHSYHLQTGDYAIALAFAQSAVWEIELLARVFKRERLTDDFDGVPFNAYLSDPESDAGAEIVL